MSNVLKKTYSVEIRTGITCTTRIYQVSQSRANNTTTYRAKVTLYCYNGASYHLDDDGVIKIKVAGVTSLSATGLTGFNFGSYTSIEIFNDTATVTHDTDGSFSKIFSTICKYPESGSYASGTGSGTVTFTTINRKSVIGTISSFNIEDTFQIPITKYVSSFYHILTLTLNTFTKIIAGYESNDDITLTDDEILELYNLIADTSATMQLSLATYDSEGGSLIGTDTDTATAIAIGTAYIKQNGVYNHMLPYAKISGAYVKTLAYVKTSGVYKRGIT